MRGYYGFPKQSLPFYIVVPTLSGNWCEAHLVPFEELLWLPHHWRGVAH